MVQFHSHLLLLIKQKAFCRQCRLFFSFTCCRANEWKLSRSILWSGNHNYFRPMGSLPTFHLKYYFFHHQTILFLEIKRKQKIILFTWFPCLYMGSRASPWMYTKSYTFAFRDRNCSQSVISVTSFDEDKRWPQMVRVCFFFCHFSHDTVTSCRPVIGQGMSDA